MYANIKIYNDPVKQFIKVTDISILESFFRIREDYDKIMSASLISELVIKTAGCGGEYGQVLELTRNALRAIETSNKSKAIVLAYLWRVLRIMGLGPDIDHCSQCGHDLSVQNPQDRRGFFISDVAEGFQCSSCAHGGTWHIDSVREYLGSIMESEIESVVDMRIPEEILAEIEHIVLPLAQRATEGSLQTLKRMDGNYFNSLDF
jgi:DNA repair protein RecO